MKGSISFSKVHVQYISFPTVERWNPFEN